MFIIAIYLSIQSYNGHLIALYQYLHEQAINKYKKLLKSMFSLGGNVQNMRHVQNYAILCTFHAVVHVDVHT